MIIQLRTSTFLVRRIGIKFQRHVRRRCQTILTKTSIRLQERRRPLPEAEQMTTSPYPFLLILLLLVVVWIQGGYGLSYQVSLPLKKSVQQSTEFAVQQKLKIAFQDVVESSQFLVQTSPSQVQSSVCSVPALGDHIEVKFGRSASDPSEILLKIDGTASDEFGWICVEFYENKELLQDIVDTSDLRTAVINHYNAQPPHPGFPANSAKLAGSRQVEDLFGNHRDMALSELERQGFIILDNGPKSTELGHGKLTQYLNEKTNQGSSIRTDTVHFLSRDEARGCGFEEVRQNESSDEEGVNLLSHNFLDT